MSLAARWERPRLRPGVAKLRGKILGRNAYVAITSALELLHGAIFLVTERMPDEEIVVWLRAELRSANREQKPHLQLMPRTVTAAIDGPSPSHPQRTAEPSVTLRTVEDLDVGARSLESFYEPGSVMHGVCVRLSQLLEESA